MSQKKSFLSSVKNALDPENTESIESTTNIDNSQISSNIKAEETVELSVKNVFDQNAEIDKNHQSVTLLAPDFISVLAKAKIIDFSQIHQAKATISKDHNKKIKKMAMEFDVTSQGLLHAILEQFFTQNEKEIAKQYKKLQK